MKVLIVEDDAEMSDYLAHGLEQAGHDAVVCREGSEGLTRARQGGFDVIVLDRMLPELNGLQVLEALRSDGNRTPVLFLSALGEVDHRIEGLQAGADDYLSKPFAMLELLARVEALHRRDSGAESQTRLQVGDLTLDLVQHQAQRGDQIIELWPLEYRLLEYLMRHAGQVVTRGMLLENVWNLSFDPQTNVVEVHISRLRGKIDKHFDQPLIHTVRGQGYTIREH